MTREQCIELLEKKLPFASSSVSDPKDLFYPDIQSINKNVYDDLYRLIQHKGQNPKLGLAALVLGEAGDGKTHLINRLICNSREKNEYPYIVAYIQPIEDPTQTYPYLLREIVSNLFFPMEKDSPMAIMDSILAELIKQVIPKCSFKNKKFQAVVNNAIQNKPTSIFHEVDLSEQSWKVIENKIIKEFSGVCDPVLIRVLIQLRHVDRRFAIIDWLKCNALDSEAAKLIKVKPANIQSHEATEQAARDMIRNISVLIGNCNQSLLVCFDRLENLNTSDKIQSFGKMIEFLVDDAPSMMPAAFCRGDLWDNYLQDKFNSHVSGRLKSNCFVLSGCNYEQAMELISSRLTWAYGHSAHNFCPFNEDDLIQSFHHRVTSARNVIQKAKELLPVIEPQPILPIPEQLMTHFQKLYKKIINEFDRHSPERLRLRRALLLFFEIIDCAVNTQTGDDYIDFTFSLDKPKPKEGMVLIDVKSHHSSVAASLRRGIDYLTANKNSHVFYFRDERCFFPKPPKWKATNIVLDKFKGLGGHVMIMDRNEAAQCYAVTLMNYEITSGDVSIDTPDFQTEKASIEQYMHFLHTYVNNEPFTLFKKMGKILELRKKVSSPTPPPPPIRSGKELLKNILDCLRPQPMMMASTKNILEYLSNHDIQTNLDEVMKLIKRFNDRFVIHQSKTDPIVMIKKEWMNAQP